MNDAQINGICLSHTTENKQTVIDMNMSLSGQASNKQILYKCITPTDQGDNCCLT